MFKSLVPGPVTVTVTARQCQPEHASEIAMNVPVTRRVGGDRNADGHGNLIGLEQLPYYCTGHRESVTESGCTGSGNVQIAVSRAVPRLAAAGYPGLDIAA